MCYKLCADFGDEFSQRVNSTFANLIDLPLLQFNRIEVVLLEAFEFRIGHILNSYHSCSEKANRAIRKTSQG